MRPTAVTGASGAVTGESPTRVAGTADLLFFLAGVPDFLAGAPDAEAAALRGADARGEEVRAADAAGTRATVSWTVVSWTVLSGTTGVAASSVAGPHGLGGGDGFLLGAGTGFGLALSGLLGGGRRGWRRVVRGGHDRSCPRQRGWADGGVGRWTCEVYRRSLPTLCG